MGNRRLKDTDKNSERIQNKILREMPKDVKIEISLDLARTAIELLKTGIRQRHPEYTDDEIEDALKRIILSDDLYEKVYHKC